MGTMIAGAILGLFLVALLVVLVLMTNPPNKWVQKLSKDEAAAAEDRTRERAQAVTKLAKGRCRCRLM